MPTLSLTAALGLLLGLVHLVPAGQSDSLRQAAPSPLVPPGNVSPLNCRGGAGLAFDTIGPPDGGGVRVSITFAASPTGAGAEGQGLAPGSCAWVDRPVGDGEPRRIQVTIGIGDSTPARTVVDTAVYWSFLAHRGDGGQLTSVGYRHWHAASPPAPHPAPAPLPTLRRSVPLPFDLRYLPLLVVGLVAITYAPVRARVARWSGWHRLASLYPNRNQGNHRSIRVSPVLMGKTTYKGGVRLTPDGAHLHFATVAFVWPGHRPFSVPWSDITASRDQWPWFPLKGYPMIRLTLARDRDLRILVPVRDSDRLVAASGGRLQVGEAPAPAAEGD